PRTPRHALSLGASPPRSDRVARSLRSLALCCKIPAMPARIVLLFLAIAALGGAQPAQFSNAVRGFIKVDAPVVALTHVRVIDGTAPYLNGPNTFLQMRDMKDADEARRQVAYWADMGATSFKAYMQISRAQLGAAVEEAHKRGLKITGHLCSVTYAEAADLGIDDLEHGFMVATDFVSDKKPDECPGQAVGQRTIAVLDEQGEPFKALVKKLVDKHVAL